MQILEPIWDMEIWQMTSYQLIYDMTWGMSIWWTDQTSWSKIWHEMCRSGRCGKCGPDNKQHRMCIQEVMWGRQIWEKMPDGLCQDHAGRACTMQWLSRFYELISWHPVWNKVGVVYWLQGLQRSCLSHKVSRKGVLKWNTKSHLPWNQLTVRVAQKRGHYRSYWPFQVFEKWRWLNSKSPTQR